MKLSLSSMSVTTSAILSGFISSQKIDAIRNNAGQITRLSVMP
jgi:hypothetical protein